MRFFRRRFIWIRYVFLSLFVSLLVCNHRRHAVKSIADLPIRQFLTAGIPVTINTDDMTVSNVTLEGEYEKVIETFKLTDEEVETLWSNAIDAAFLDDKGKAELRKKLKERL